MTYQEGDIVITTRLCYDFDFESTELYSDLYPPLAKGLHLKVLRAYTEHLVDWIVVSGPNERRYDINVAGVAVLENKEDRDDEQEEKELIEKGKKIKDGEVEFESAAVPPLGFATGRTWGDK